MADVEITLKAWMFQLDKHGADVPLDVLERAIDSAPQELRSTPEYSFFEGLMYGKMLEKGVL
jgi:hypothetical protein